MYVRAVGGEKERGYTELNILFIYLSENTRWSLVRSFSSVSFEKNNCSVFLLYTGEREKFLIFFTNSSCDIQVLSD